MTTFLLDVNVLLALCDPMHVHHEASHRWFADKGQRSWATCPLTENGFVRVASHPSYPNRPGDVHAVCEILRQLCAAVGHQFWLEDISILEIVEAGQIFSHAHVTDVYLAAMAAHRGGRLATLDRHIPIGAIRGGSQVLELIPV